MPCHAARAIAFASFVTSGVSGPDDSPAAKCCAAASGVFRVALEWPLLPERRLERRGGVGTFVPILHDDGRVKRQAVFVREVRFDRSCPGHDDRVLGHLQRLPITSCDYFFIHQVVDPGCPGKHNAGRQHGAPADDATFINSASAAEKNVVFDDYRHRPDWFEHASNLNSGG